MNNKSKKFWEKVAKCKHEWSETYNPLIRCSTPYCTAWENHCIKCGVYQSDCKCGCEFGQDGWSSKRRDSWNKKKYPLLYGIGKIKGK